MTSADCLNEILGEIPYGITRYGNALPLLECRAASRIPENAKSVIFCVFPYLVKEKGKRNLCYYACVPDYHTVVGNILKSACEKLSERFGGSFAYFVDNSPFREAELASRCGLGVMGENHLLITPQYGSYVFIGEIVTDMVFPHTETEQGECLHCGRCREACATGVLRKEAFDKRECLSDITQRKGELSDGEISAIKAKGLAWGCDSCQTCCPMNENAKETEIPEFRERAKHFLREEEIPEFLPDSACNWRGEKVIRRNVGLVNE